MESKSKTRKLSELRAKTDRQLVALIEHKLDRGLHVEASALLPLINGAERFRLEQKAVCMQQRRTCASMYAA